MMILVIRIVTESKIAIGTVQFGTNYGVSNKSGVTESSSSTSSGAPIAPAPNPSVSENDSDALPF